MKKSMGSRNLFLKKKHMFNEDVPRRKPKVAICHPRLGYGGSEKKVWWGIEALKDSYEVTLVTAGKFDLEDMNKYYGTQLSARDFNVRQAPVPFFLRRNEKAAALRWALYQRFCRRIAAEYDVLISAYDPCDFGVPAIHFISDFSWDDEIRKRLHPPSPGFVYRENMLRKSYLLLSRALCNYSGRNLYSGEDMMIAVSPWVAKTMMEKYKVDCKVIYSPVPGDYPNIEFLSREVGFVSLGRISPEKRIERTIEILSLVRAKGHNVHYHIIGGVDNNAYNNYIKKLSSRCSGWVTLENRLYGKEKIDMLSRHRFGIHGCQGDAFPGAVVEMMKAGCIVFVPNEGGQVDMVGHALLTYESIDDAVSKIDMILRNVHLQHHLIEHLTQQAKRYSVENFMTEMREAVSEFLNGKKGRHVEFIRKTPNLSCR